MKLRLNANGIIFNDKEEILLITLKKGKFKDKLCIPGGGIEPGETSIDTLKREIKEATGIILDKNQIKNINKLSIRKNQRIPRNIGRISQNNPF